MSDGFVISQMLKLFLLRFILVNFCTFNPQYEVTPSICVINISDQFLVNFHAVFICYHLTFFFEGMEYRTIIFNAARDGNLRRLKVRSIVTFTLD